jgi:hypothetical protein
VSRLDAFERLAAKARNEPAPELDVSRQVLASIRTMGAARLPVRPMMAFTGLSLAAASVVAFFSYQAWMAVQDPFAGFFTSLTMVMR